MKVFLRWALNFLERKFPDKVVVTVENYKAMEMRMTVLESELKRLHVLMGLSSIKRSDVGTAGAFNLER